MTTPTPTSQRAGVTAGPLARRLGLAGFLVVGSACASAPPPPPPPPTPPTEAAAPRDAATPPPAAPVPEAAPAVPTAPAPPTEAADAATRPSPTAATPPSATPPDAAPPSRLRTGRTERNAQAVRRSLDRTTTQLTLIDRRQLGRSDKAQFDTARQFVELAEAALEMNNIVFATELAEKASTLATALSFR